MEKLSQCAFQDGRDALHQTLDEPSSFQGLQKGSVKTDLLWLKLPIGGGGGGSLPILITVLIIDCNHDVHFTEI